MAVLSNDTLYTIYQQNLSLLETQMELVKSTTFKNIGIYEWEKNLYISKTPNNTSSLNGTLQKRNNDILAGTRLYTFLLCSWLESRLNKILYIKLILYNSPHENLVNILICFQTHPYSNI